jgi:hypothetical protein
VFHHPEVQSLAGDLCEQLVGVEALALVPQLSQQVTCST